MNKMKRRNWHKLWSHRTLGPVFTKDLLIVNICVPDVTHLSGFQHQLTDTRHEQVVTLGCCQVSVTTKTSTLTHDVTYTLEVSSSNDQCHKLANVTINVKSHQIQQPMSQVTKYNTQCHKLPNTTTNVTSYQIQQPMSQVTKYNNQCKKSPNTTFNVTSCQI